MRGGSRTGDDDADSPGLGWIDAVSQAFLGRGQDDRIDRWITRAALSGPCRFVCAGQGALTYWIKSNAHPVRGSVSRTARVSAARRNPKEAVSRLSRSHERGPRLKAKAGSLRGKPGAYSQSGTRQVAALARNPRIRNRTSGGVGGRRRLTPPPPTRYATQGLALAEFNFGRLLFSLTPPRDFLRGPLTTPGRSPEPAI